MLRYALKLRQYQIACLRRCDLHGTILIAAQSQDAPRYSRMFAIVGVGQQSDCAAISDMNSHLGKRAYLVELFISWPVCQGSPL